MEDVWVGVESFQQWSGFSAGRAGEERKEDENIELGHGGHWCLEVVVGQFKW
jgi:hypothetical protein